jgi:tyrosyl-tRNA synthetase
MGGSDQWGNILSGTEFIRRNEPGSEVFALTSPLLTKADGKKFGKSEEGNIWLDAEMTTPYKFYQFWLNIDDGEISKLYRYFSLLSKEEMQELEAHHKDNPQMLKRLLGEELTTRIRGENAYRSVKNVTDILFNPKANANQLQGLSEKEFKQIVEEIPSYQWSDEFGKGAAMNVIELVTQAKIFSSKSEARKAIENNAVSVNKIKVTDINSSVSSSDLLHQRYLFVENGKKNKHMIVFGY